jgi:hypothetical protein
MNKAKAFGRILALSTVFATLIVIVFYGLATTHPVVHARAQDENATTGCTLATISGDYGSLAIGESPVYTHTGIFTPNGAGKFVYDYTEQYDGTIYSGKTFSGTYTLKSSCAMTMTFKNEGETYTYAGVVVTNGNEIDLMSTTPGLVSTWVSKKIN